MLTSAAVAHDYKNVITEASKCVSSTNNSLPHMIKKTVICLKNAKPII